MAQQPSPKVVSQFPLPPKRYYHNPAIRPPPLPSSNDSYSMFGRVYSTEDVLPSLEEAGRKRLYDASAPPCQELRRMNQDLLRLFIKLVNELCDPLPLDSSDNPHKQLIDEIEDTFVNMQHLINVMRPTQAAMDLKTLLDRQTDARKDMAEKLKDSVRKAWELIGDAADKLSEPSVQLSDHARVPLDPPVAAPDPMLCPPPQTVANTDMPSFYEERPITQILADIDQIVLDPSI